MKRRLTRLAVTAALALGVAGTTAACNPIQVERTVRSGGVPQLPADQVMRYRCTTAATPPATFYVNRAGYRDLTATGQERCKPITPTPI